MRTYEDITPLMKSLGHALYKYTVIDRKDFDFGVGVNLFPAEIHMLEAINCRNGVGVTELAEEFGVTKGAISQLINKLVKKKLVVKEPASDHKSRVVIRTTPKGKTACQNHREFHREHNKMFTHYLEQLDDKSFNTVVELTNQLNLWMDNYLK